MKVTQIILTEILVLTPSETGVWEKMKLSDSKFEFTGGVANWCRVGYNISVVNITTDVVWIPSNWMIADDTVNIERWVWQTSR